MSYRITSTPTGVVLEVDGLIATIEGPWKDANHAAHMLGSIVAGKAKANDVLSRVRYMSERLADFGEALDRAEWHLRAVAEAASADSPSGDAGGKTGP